MAKVGLFYGSNTGNTEAVAFQMKEAFTEIASGHEMDVHNIGSSSKETILQYDYLIFGIPTWNTGELQDDWDAFLPNFKEMDMKGKKLAIFGLGDQNGYGYNFLDAVGVLADESMLAGAEVYGLWSTDDYEYNESRAQIEEYFLGLGIDQEGQEEKTPARIKQWVTDVKGEFGI
ncbi:MAG: flavodoxin [Chloroflexota bacterium]